MQGLGSAFKFQGENLVAWPELEFTPNPWVIHGLDPIAGWLPAPSLPGLLSRGSWVWLGTC